MVFYFLHFPYNKNPNIFHYFFNLLFNFASEVKTKGCPKNKPGLRLYPMNLMRLIPTKGLSSKKTSVIRYSLALQLALPQQGVAVALNNRMIPRSQWAEQEIKEGDSLVIIKAACGG